MRPRHRLVKRLKAAEKSRIGSHPIIYVMKLWCHLANIWPKTHSHQLNLTRSHRAKAQCRRPRFVR